MYIAMPPLYKAMPARGKEEYLYDDKALEKYRKTHTGSFTLQRYKGLGEMDATQLWETTMDPDHRRLPGRDRGCQTGFLCNGDADGNGSAAASSVYL